MHKSTGMKRLFYLFLLISFFCRAQDTLVYRNATRTIVKLLEIGPDTILYKITADNNGLDLIVRRSELRYICFENGLKEVMDSTAVAVKAPLVPATVPVVVMPPVAPVVYNPADSAKMYRQGVKDAQTYYVHSCGAVGTGITSFLFSVAGLIPAVACSASPPKVQNLGYPSEELWQNKDYKAGYKRKAGKLKLGRVWTGFGIGFVSGIIVIIMLQPILVH